MDRRVGIEAIAVAIPRHYLTLEDLAVARGLMKLSRDEPLAVPARAGTFRFAGVREERRTYA